MNEKDMVCPDCQRMGARSGLGMTGSVPKGAVGTENDIPAPTEIDFGEEYIRGFLFDNILHSESDGDGMAVRRALRKDT